MKAGTLEIELITNVARLQKEMADMKRSVAGAMGDITESASRADKALGSAGGGGLTRMGGSAKLAGHQVQNLVYQLNDMVVGLFSGQKPMTVFMQQGTQIAQIGMQAGMSWSAQAKISPLPIAGGAGSYIWDFDGKKYLDFSGQLVFTNIGFQHPKVVKAIQDQAAQLTTIAPQHANEARGEAAKRITARAGKQHNKVFFTNGGADAVENAIRMARLHTNRHKILSFYRSYHGNTTSAIASTGDPRRWPNEYAFGHIHFFGPYLYRSPFWATTEAEECARALEHLEQVIIFEGPNTIAAILIESVVGTAGVLIPPAGYLEGVRALCDKYGIKWIADEVMAGILLDVILS